MNAPTGSKSDKARQFYNSTEATAHNFLLMNYGYAPLGAALATSAEPERYCLQMYRHVPGIIELANRRVLEVSCGRGGGAAFVVTTYEPTDYVGLDISEHNVDIATRRFAHVPGLSFRVGRAESLPFAPATFDAILNIEASHLYDDPACFFAEVKRVLRPAGVFCYVDLFWNNSDPEGLINEAGLLITHRADITAHVLQALELDSERCERIVTTSIPSHLAQAFRNWSGVKGHRAYNRFASGEWIYRCSHAQQSTLVGVGS